MKIKTAEFVKSCVAPRFYPKPEIPAIAFVGRSNVGKSTLMNRLLNRHSLVKVSSTPGKTQTINFFRINEEFFFVDLPGYGFAKVPESVKGQWKKMIETYLSESENLRGVVLLVDIRRDPVPDDLLMKKWLESYQVPCFMVATKADKLSSSQKAKSLSQIREAFQVEELIPFSSLTDEGKEPIWKELIKLLKE
ncbi:MAG: YihA family ribosome biogenesis GTP-binding protein [Nitrospirae bacterium]|nr:YihA family ribosome biogenesis GTP-binding protein [Nitrospirota bacterium]MBI3352928.1 YihA family ribosome biogenesis GTP-binding protein [Nitrospirota bacterium]